MNYQHIEKGRFLERPNRFIAYVELKGKRETVHVKNTGRCRELLKSGAVVYLEKSENPERKTMYDLVAVEKQGRIVNIDSQAPNKVVEEWLHQKLLFPDLVCVRPEVKYGNSRFDFYVETASEKVFLEVKGVTLEEDGEVRFPDAPSERAVRHLEELVQARREGYQAYVIFVIQMKDVDHFVPNEVTHPEFARALSEAAGQGVHILAFDCQVTETALTLADPVPVWLDGKPYRENVKETVDFGNLAEIPGQLLKWYDECRRVLPWREDPAPYHVWVSEIMLQQTRVEAVKPYYRRFVEVLPDVASLASAEEQMLLKLWEGLGYYSRVRNLQAAAVQIMEEHGGRMPDTYEELLTLKGIGSYTAGAIASIAFGRPVPAVDGNVLRVLSRIRRDERLISEEKVRSGIWKELREVIPAERPGDFNQAMMEIGAVVCVPNGAPHCEVCPLRNICMAHRDGCQEQYPKKVTKKGRTIEEKTVLIVQDADRAALRKRPGKGLLAGMYEFPSLEGHRTAEEVLAYLEENGLKPLRIQKIADSRHIFTHREWHMQGYMIKVDELAERAAGAETSDWIYVEPSKTRDKYPIPSAFAAYVPYLNIRQGREHFEEE